MDRHNTVFLVDDDEAVREAIGVMLEVSGFDVRTFANTSEFLSRFEPRRDACLIVDLNLPDDDGLGLVAKLDARSERLPFIVITGRGGDADRARAVAADATAFFTKPIKKEPFLAAVRQALARNV